MSNAVFPVLPGLQVTVGRLPVHKTAIKEAVSGREYRARLMSAPRYIYRLSFEFLRDGHSGYDEFRPLLGFFNARAGSFESWLYSDPDDRRVTAQAFGTGDGSTPTFQLVRTLGGTVEPVYALDGVPAIYVGGTLKTAGTHYTVTASAGIVFITPPAAGALLTWTGFYYWRCRFLHDQTEFSRFMAQLWEMKSCEFITTRS